MNDPWTTLGVDKNATDSDIKIAYRKLAQKHHPDREGGSDDKFKEVKDAYQNIKDQDARQMWEASQVDPRQSFGNRGDPFGNLHEIFRGFGQGGVVFRQQPQRNRDIQIHYDISLQEVYTGIKRQLNINIGNNQTLQLDLNVPRGVEHGDKIRYAGMGSHDDSRLPKGDLYVIIRVIEHPRFKRFNRRDLITTVTVNALRTAVGCEEFVSGLSGQEYSIKINKGTQPNTKLRIPEQGLPGRGGQQSGDLIIQVEIKVPTLSEEDLELPLKDILKK